MIPCGVVLVAVANEGRSQWLLQTGITPAFVGQYFSRPSQRPTLCCGLPRKAVGAPSHPGTACFLLTRVLGVPASLLTSLARARNNIFPILGRPPYPVVGEECYEPRAAVWPARFARASETNLQSGAGKTLLPDQPRCWACVIKRTWSRVRTRASGIVFVGQPPSANGDLAPS